MVRGTAKPAAWLFPPHEPFFPINGTEQCLANPPQHFISLHKQSGGDR